MFTKNEILKAAEQLKAELEKDFCDGDGRFLIDDVVTDLVNILKANTKESFIYHDFDLELLKAMTPQELDSWYDLRFEDWDKRNVTWDKFQEASRLYIEAMDHVLVN